MEITLGNGIIQEFKTRKAAEKFIKKLLKGGHIKRVKQSFFGHALNAKREIYQVWEEDK